MAGAKRCRIGGAEWQGDPRVNADVLIIGSGAAGLTAALRLAQKCRVVVLAKGAISDGATSWAQGGIAAVLPC